MKLLSTVISFILAIHLIIAQDTCQVCWGDTIEIKASVTSGLKPLTYSWSCPNINDTTVVLEDIRDRIWCSLLVIDNAGCEAIDSYYVTPLDSQIITGLPDTSLCSITDSLTVFVELSSPIEDSSAWILYYPSGAIDTCSECAISQEIKTLESGIHVLQIIHPRGCSFRDTFEVIGGVAPEVSLTSSNYCDGITTLVFAAISGGVSPYTYLWDDGSTSGLRFSEESATIQDSIYTYYVTVTDNIGCTDQDSTSFQVYAEPYLLSTTVLDENCTGLGSICVEFEDNLSRDSLIVYIAGQTIRTTDQNITCVEVPRGNYALSAEWIDVACGVVIFDSIAVDTIPDPEIVVSNLTGEICEGDTTMLTVSVSGGEGPYSYEWSDGQIGNAIYVSPLIDSLYGVTLTDANGCQDSAVIEVLVNPLPRNFTATVANEICRGALGSIEINSINATGMVSYEWSNGDVGTIADSLSAGFYSVTATDSKGCINDTTFEVINDTLLIAINETIGNAFCGLNGSIVINTNADQTGLPISYEWSNGATTKDISGLVPGAYSITVTSGACSSTRTYTVGDGGEIDLTASITNEVCGSLGAINLTPTFGTGTYSYQWSNGATSQDISGLQNGTYTVTVTSGTCTEIKSFSVQEQNYNINANAGPNRTICEGQSTTLSASASGASGLSYSWSPSTGLSCTSCLNPTVSGLSAGTYNYTFTASIGSCSDSDVVTVSVGDQISVDAGNFFAVCDTLLPRTLTGASSTGSNLSYSWATPIGLNMNNTSSLFPTITTSTPGLYTATLTASNSFGCTASDTRSILIEECIDCNCNASISLNSSCTIVSNLNGSGCSGYAVETVLRNGSQVATSLPYSPSQPGTYTVRFGKSGCSDLLPSSINVDGPTNGGSLSPSSLPGGCGSYTTPSIVASGFSGCNSHVINWSEYKNGSSAGPIIHTGSTLPPQTYTGAQSVRLRATYECASLCGGSILIGEITFDVEDPPNVNAGTDESICQGALPKALNNTAGGALVYQWSTPSGITINNPGDRNPTISSANIGSYALTLTGSNDTQFNCTDTDVKVVTITPPPSVTASAPSEVCPGENFTLSATSGFANYRWYLGSIAISSQRTTTQSISSASTFTVEAWDDAACKASDNVSVGVKFGGNVNMQWMNNTARMGDQIHIRNFVPFSEFSQIDPSHYTVTPNLSGSVQSEVTNTNYSDFRFTTSSSNPATTFTIEFNHTTNDGCPVSGSITICVPDVNGSGCSSTNVRFRD